MYSEFSKDSLANVVKAAVNFKFQLIESGQVENLPVKFSTGNTKTGQLVPSVSLIPVHDCGKNCAVCSSGCYDVRHDLIYKAVRTGRAINSAIYASDPSRYFGEIIRYCRGLRFFRFHIGGDIMDYQYWCGVLSVAAACPGCRILIFTKQYDIVNNWLRDGGAIPENLQIIFSCWPGLELDNPYNFPVSYPKFEDGGKYGDKYAGFNSLIPGNAVRCGGDCSACALDGCGCFDLTKGQAVYFDAH